MCNTYPRYTMSFRPIYVLRPYFTAHIDKVEWEFLSQNPNAIDMIRDNIDKVETTHLCWNEHPDAIRMVEDRIEDACWDALSCNSSATYVLEQHLDKIKLFWLCHNNHPNAVRLFNAYVSKHECFDTINQTMWHTICANPTMISIVNEHLQPDSANINWFRLSTNPRAILILEQNLDKVDWEGLSKNPNAIHILQQHVNKVNWKALSTNPNPDAMHILQQHSDKIRQYELAGCSNCPRAIHMLENNLNTIDWDQLSENIHAIRVLENNLDRAYWWAISNNPAAHNLWEVASSIGLNPVHIDWELVWRNPSIFKLNTDAMKYQCLSFHNELVSTVTRRGLSCT